MSSPRIVLRGIGEWSHLTWTAHDRLSIGRLGSCEAAIDHPSVSRRHVEVAFNEQGWVVRDLGSTNGTRLNGVRLGRIEQRLRLHDTVQPGSVLLSVVEVADETEATQTGPANGAESNEDTILQRHEDSVMLPRDKREFDVIQAGDPLSQDKSLDSLLQATLRQMARALRADGGAVLLADQAKRPLSLRAACGAVPDFHLEDEALAQRCYERKASLLGNNSGRKKAPSVVCALLRTPTRNLGVVQLQREPGRSPFGPADLRLADALASNVSAGIEYAQLLLDGQRNLYLQTVLALAQAVECRDPYTAGHTQRVTDYSLLLAEELKLSADDYQRIQIGTPLHDIGKIGIDDSVLRKPERLTAAEFEQIKAHPVKGVEILETIPQLHPILPIVRSHHERWDGSGYPDHLAGEAIPALARLVTVADVFDALTSERPYRAALPPAEAFSFLKAGAGTQFDPAFVDGFLALRPRLEGMLRERGAVDQTVSKQDVDKILKSLRREGFLGDTPGLPRRPDR